MPTPSWEWKPLTLVLGGLDGSVASSSVLPGFFQSLPSLKRILKQTSVKSSQLPCIDVARVSYSSDLKRKQNQGLEFSQVPTKPCPPPPPHYYYYLFFFLKSWKMSLVSSEKDTLHVEFKLVFPIIQFIQSHFLRVQSLLLQSRKGG